MFAVALLLAGCGGVVRPEIPTKTRNAPDVSGIKLSQGDASTPVNKIAIEAIADLQSFWGKHFKDLYGEDYQPVQGGFYAVLPSSDAPPPCAEDASQISGNAFYCSTKDVVAWDAEDLLPSLQKRFGDFVIPIVLAHEWGHAIQGRSNFTARTVTKELQADCFAGAWSKHAKDDNVFLVSDSDLDLALAGILELRDSPGDSKLDPNAHGSGFDRVGAFQDGFDNGIGKCKDYRDDDPVVLELPFNDEQDEAQGGNAPYDEIVNGVPYDLEDYWTQVYPEIADGQQWTEVKGLKPFDPSDPPTCGGAKVKTDLIYCAADDYVGWDNTKAMPKLYAQAGDYAVASQLAKQYGLAALDRLGDQSDENTKSLRSDCLAGSYTASVIIGNRSKTSTYRISPGDLDEAIKALLVARDGEQADGGGKGLPRVRAFREGVIDGAQPCLTYGT